MAKTIAVVDPDHPDIGVFLDGARTHFVLCGFSIAFHPAVGAYGVAFNGIPFAKPPCDELPVISWAIQKPNSPYSELTSAPQGYYHEGMSDIRIDDYVNGGVHLQNIVVQGLNFEGVCIAYDRIIRGAFALEVAERLTAAPTQ